MPGPTAILKGPLGKLFRSVVGVLLFLLGFFSEDCYTRREVSRFTEKADMLFQQERYEDIVKLAEGLSDRAKNDKNVEYTRLRASIFKCALEHEVFDVTDRTELIRLRTDAEFLDQHEPSAKSATLVGIMYSLLDCPQKANAHFAKANDRAADHPFDRAYNYNAWGYAAMTWEQCDHSEPWDKCAEDMLNKAAELSHDYEWPLINLGILALTRAVEPDYAAALKRFDEAEQRKPSSPNAYMDSGVCLLNLGRIQRRQGDEARAQEYIGQASSKFRKAYELGLDSAMLHLNWGSLFSTMGDYANALRQYDRALQLQPKFIDACVSKAAVLEKIGKHDSAAEVLRQCSTLCQERISHLGQRGIETPESEAADRLREVANDFTRMLHSTNEQIHPAESTSQPE